MTAVRLLGVLALVAAAISARGAPGVISPGAVVLKNANGVEAHVLPTGACVQRLLVPDRDGKVTDVMLGFEDVEQYKVRRGRLSRRVPPPRHAPVCTGAAFT